MILGRQLGSGRRALGRIFSNPLSAAGMAIVIVMAGIAVFAGLIAPNPYTINLDLILQPPSSQFPFGTDELGRNLFGRVIYGSQISLSIGLVATSLALLVGTTIGLAAGYLRGWVDELLMRIADIFLSIPSIILAILFMVILGRNVYNAMVAIGITLWPVYARLIRGVVLSVRESLYVEAARAFSAGDFRILFRHILPNAFTPLIIQSSFDYGNSILYAAALGFLGLGAQPPTPEWGALISVGRAFLPQWWWYATFPGIFILVTVLGFNLLGDGLRDIFDVRFQKK